MLHSKTITLDCGPIKIAVTGADSDAFVAKLLQSALPEAATMPPPAAPGIGAPGELLTASDLARRFGTSRPLMAHWERKGWLPPRTLASDGRRGWPADELEAFLASPALARSVWRRLHVRQPDVIEGGAS